jgi:hypothetical protein
MLIRPFDPPDTHRGSAELAREVGGEIPIGARLATKQVQTNRLVFGKSMTGEMRFGK